MAQRWGAQGDRIADATRPYFLGAFQSSMRALAVVVIAAVSISVWARPRGRTFPFAQRRVGR